MISDSKSHYTAARLESRADSTVGLIMNLFCFTLVQTRVPAAEGCVFMVIKTIFTDHSCTKNNQL